MPRPFSAAHRAEIFADAKARPLDLLIVGGGITGAGIFQDASLRGLRTLLLEKEDFAYGTSSRSSKLIHGGLRYLETFDLKLVFEACRERKILLNIAPDHVRPLRFHYPVYRGQPRSLPAVAAGVFAYSLLSSGRNLGWPRLHTASSVRRTIPGLRSQGLVGSASYWDAVTHDALLTLAVVRSGWNGGGLAVNHAEGISLSQQRAEVVGMKVRDRLTDEVFELRSRWVVSATGPWGDRFRSAMKPKSPPHLRLTKGVHLVFRSEDLPLSDALLLRSPSDGRVTFLIPWQNAVLAGTTDTDFTGDPAEVSATEDDVDYLIDNVRWHFPDRSLSSSDVVSTFAGLRPLLADTRAHPSAVSREHRIFSEQPGWVTISGGKLTTYRSMAEDLVDHLIRRTPEWNKRITSCRTKTSLLPSRAAPFPSELERIQRAVREEMAATVGDVLSRRCSYLFLRPDHGLSFAPEAARELAPVLSKGQDWIDREIAAYAQLAASAEAGLRRHPRERGI